MRWGVDTHTQRHKHTHTHTHTDTERKRVLIQLSVIQTPHLFWAMTCSSTVMDTQMTGERWSYFFFYIPQIQSAHGKSLQRDGCSHVLLQGCCICDVISFWRISWTLFSFFKRGCSAKKKKVFSWKWQWKLCFTRLLLFIIFKKNNSTFYFTMPGDLLFTRTIFWYNWYQIMSYFAWIFSFEILESKLICILATSHMRRLIPLPCLCDK